LDGKKLKRSGKGWTASCPCGRHENGDQNASLSIREGADGKVLLNCFAGGSIEGIASGLGLDMQDLFLDKEQTVCKPSKASRVKVTAGFKEAAKSLVAEYDYTDANGKLLYQNVRYKLFDGSKTFQARQPGSNGTPWLYKLEGVQRVLYRLPEVLEAVALERTVYVVEGEKDVDRLRSFGLTATTSSSASSWRPEFAEVLTGADVVIVQDLDKAGDAYRDAIGSSLEDKAKRCRVVWLPVEWRESHGLDVSDWLDSGGTAEQLQQLVDAAPLWRKGMGSKKGPILQTITAAALQEKQFAKIRWAVPDLLPEGLTLLAGRPKQGKSWLAFAIGLGIALGGRVLGKVQVEAGSVLYLALEDRERRLQERQAILMQGSQAPDKLHFTTACPRLDSGGLEAIREWLDSYRDARLVIVDTLACIRPPAKKGGNLYAEDTQFIQSLKRIADDYSVSVLAVHHTRKAQADDPVDSISGTLGLGGAADGWLILQRKRGHDRATLSVDGRDIPNAQDMALQWHQDRASWELLGTAEEVGLNESQNDVMEILRANADKAMSPTAIWKALSETFPDMTLNAVKMRLRKMVDDGVLRLDSRANYARAASAKPDKPARPDWRDK
jgi:RecA-family ATPase